MKRCCPPIRRVATIRSTERLPRLVVCAFSFAVCATVAATSRAEEPINYNRDIRPILSNNCYQCHGPDEGERQAGLRLDIEESAKGELDSGETAIVPGDLEASALWQRVTSDDEYMRMPPAEADKQLTAEQIENLRRWIVEGAEWRGHWAFETPTRPEVPEVELANWPRGAIDHFVMRRLEQEGLKPMPEADRAKLIRRVTLDLTGLPPTPDEVNAFVLDNSPHAYEQLVDRLLTSTRYGEHTARYWLDLARYGDTHGLHLDNYRSIWPYRDWVIEAFNRNMPFDQFTIEQLAGDLLPEPTQDQLVATGFNRCNVTTSEGGSIDAEYLVRYAVDRVETTSTVWMGLTTGCAVCHDHKFDPISQREFYQLFAYFYSLTEKAMDGNAANPPPVIPVPTPEQQTQLAGLDHRIKQLVAQRNGPMPEIDAAQAQWESKWSERAAGRWTVLDPAKFNSTGGASLRKLEDYSILAEGENPARDVYEIEADVSVNGIVALKLEALLDDSLVEKGPGRASNANFVLSEIEAEAVSLADPTQIQPVQFIAATADFSQTEGGNYPVAAAIDGIVDNTNGWAVAGYERHEPRTAIFYPAAPIGFEGGTTLRVRLRFESHFGQHAIGRVRLSASTDAQFVPTTSGPWYSVGPFTAESGKQAHDTAFGPEQQPIALDQTYQDGKLKWQRLDDFEPGKAYELKGERAAVYFHHTIYSPAERPLTLYIGSDDAVKVWLNGDVVHDSFVRFALSGASTDQDRVEVTLRPGENRLLAKVINHEGDFSFVYRDEPDEDLKALAEVEHIFAKSPEERTKEEKTRLREVYRQTYSADWREINAQLAALRQQRKKVEAEVPTTMVMQDMPEKRDTYVLIRGQYDQPDKEQPVQPGVPDVLPPLPEDATPNRLALARWLVSPEHPLTARVTVNRFWQQFFGHGIVKTAEDFGSQGEWPTHPALLDWLALEFIESGWDVKHIVRLMVTSAAYRQSSEVTPERLRLDPENRLISRGPRYRMDAEMVRDMALYVSGLLNEKVGGPSVKPYQPLGLWKEVGYTRSNTANFVQDEGAKLYRRSLYTFWKRTSPPPSMSTFDAPTREACTVRRPRTNTPLQALVLMNDVQFVEAARHFAKRLLRHEADDADERLIYGFRLVTSRRPNIEELDILRKTLDGHLEKFAAAPEDAQQLLTMGDSPRDESLDASQHAAWTMIASLLLNLDETITKN